MPTNEWRVSPLYEGVFEVSINGEVRRDGKIKRPHKNSGGYFVVNVNVNGKHTTGLVHRLVASAFVPNPNNKPEVNHIDGNKENNCADNLEWVTAKENIAHARKTGLMGESDEHLAKLNDGAQRANKRRSKIVIRDDGERYESITEAALKNNVSRRCIYSSAHEGWKANGHNFELRSRDGGIN